ncbi:B3 domain-containing protein-like [Iris pallida]|uniref:B3 domain-containing protein-like n=1 Tax=Iris pallida TaxID=29817 RepID=A0AAX6H1Y0_IRIPA|nr:B3 domain-containing protein-like [Iris pallida]
MARLNFITIMAQGFYQEMVLPEKIVKCSREELSENVILKGPSGNLWRVKLLKVEGDLLFKDGWKEFVEAHSIEEGDILSFAYEGYSCFNVLIYDKGDYCEKETSYFARNHKNVLADGACPPKKQSPGDSADMLKPPPADTSEVQSPKVNYDDNPHVEQLSPQAVQPQMDMLLPVLFALSWVVEGEKLEKLNLQIIQWVLQKICTSILLWIS